MLRLDGDAVQEILPEVDPRIFAMRARRSLALLILELLLSTSTDVNIDDGVEMSDIWSELRFEVMARGESRNDPCSVTGDHSGGGGELGIENFLWRIAIV